MNQELDDLATIDLATVLARLDMIAGVGAAGFNSGGSAGSEDPGGKRPAGDGRSPADPYRANMAAVDTEYERKREQALDDHALDIADGWWLEQHARILSAAIAELAALTGRTGAPPHRREAVLDDPGKLAELVLTQGEGHPAEVVAAKYKLSPHMVRRMRRRAVNAKGESEPRDPETGKPLEREVVPAGAERKRRARAMAEQGYSERQIGYALGCHRKQVQRDLGRAA